MRDDAPRMGERDHDRDQPRDQLGDKPTTGRRRVSVPEAADLLGLTVEAIRGRIKRGTIEHERAGERVFVLVDTDKPPTSHSQSSDKPSDQPTDQHPDQHDPTRELVEELRDRVASLERELERRSNELERELERRSIEATRYQEIIAGLTQANTRLSARVPELPAASHEEPPGARESAAKSEPSTNTTPASASPQKGTQHRSLWRRIFGG